MKKIFILITVAAFAFSMASCKKCSTCVVTDSNGDVIYTAPESCDKKKYIDEYEANIKEIWETSDQTVTCTTK